MEWPAHTKRLPWTFFVLFDCSLLEHEGRLLRLRQGLLMPCYLRVIRQRCSRLPHYSYHLYYISLIHYLVFSTVRMFVRCLLTFVLSVRRLARTRVTREPMTHHEVMSCSLIPSITRRWCHVHCSSLDVTRRWSSDRYLRYLYLYVVSWIDISDILSFIIY